MQRRSIVVGAGTTLASALAGCLTGSGTGLGAGAAAETIEHDGRTRRYRLLTPEGAGPWPAVFVLHGGGGSPEQVASNTAFNTRGPEHGFAVVYPAGFDNWNDGREGPVNRGRQDIDDVGFMRALAERLVDQGIALPERLYWTGISNGAMMTFRIVIDAADLLDGAATFAGSIPKPLDGTPDEPVAMFVHHGTADPLVPYGGGAVGYARGRGRRGDVVSAEETVQLFREANGCAGEPTVRRDNETRDGTRLETRRYPGCAEPVVHQVVHGGGHRWPGGSSSVLDLLLGARTREFEAAEEVVRFFSELD